MLRNILLLSLFAVSSAPLSAFYLLDDVMTREEQHRTGIDKLNAKQKMELEKWLNANFDMKSGEPEPASRQVDLSVNVNNGKRLRMSDGSLYEIAPGDVVYTALWITPFPLKITETDDPYYPYKITNTNTGRSVMAKEIEPPRQ